MLLLAAGILYLVGVAIVLVLKPTIMFTEEGTWKEFGIGRNPNTHTLIPFWLFAILWALISYIVMSLVFGIYGMTKQIEKRGRRRVPYESPDYESEVPVIPIRRGKPKVPEGYYILNAEGTEEAGGVPKYIFLGKGLPEE